MVEVVDNPHLAETDKLRRLLDSEEERIRQLQKRLNETRDEIEFRTDEVIKFKNAIELEKVRALQFVLKERRLGVCSRLGYEHKDKNMLQTPEEELGIFSLSDFRYLYTHKYGAQGYGAWFKVQIEMLCYKHFPLEPDYQGSSGILPRITDTSSEVKKINDKWVATVDGLDVTDVPVSREYHKDIFGYLNISFPERLSFVPHHNMIQVYSTIDSPEDFVSQEVVHRETALVPSWIKYG